MTGMGQNSGDFFIPILQILKFHPDLPLVDDVIE